MFLFFWLLVKVKFGHFHIWLPPHLHLDSLLDHLFSWFSFRLFGAHQSLLGCIFTGPKGPDQGRKFEFVSSELNEDRVNGCSVPHCFSCRLSRQPVALQADWSSWLVPFPLKKVSILICTRRAAYHHAGVPHSMLCLFLCCMFLPSIKLGTFCMSSKSEYPVFMVETGGHNCWIVAWYGYPFDFGCV